MALPAVAGVAALFARLGPLLLRAKTIKGQIAVGTAAVAGTEAVKFLADGGLQEWWQDVQREVAVHILEKTGLELHEKDPFSDASLSDAVGKRMGITIRTLRDKEALEEDVLTGASQKLGDRTGLYLSNLKDKEAIQKDVLNFASGKVMERTGIPITDITDIEKTKGEVKEWAITQAYQYMASDAKVAEGMFSAAGVDVDAIVSHLNGQLKEKDGAKTMNTKSVLGALVQTGLLQQLARVASKVAVAATKTRRQAQLAAASQRFREKHGSRQVYVRISEPMPFKEPERQYFD